jgi:hypothetical protein
MSASEFGLVGRSDLKIGCSAYSGNLGRLGESINDSGEKYGAAALGIKKFSEHEIMFGCAVIFELAISILKSALPNFMTSVIMSVKQPKVIYKSSTETFVLDSLVIERYNFGENALPIKIDSIRASNSLFLPLDDRLFPESFVLKICDIIVDLISLQI